MGNWINCFESFRMKQAHTPFRIDEYCSLGIGQQEPRGGWRVWQRHRFVAEPMIHEGMGSEC